MQSFSAIQRALLDARDDQIKMAIFLDDTTPIRKCSGADPIQIDGEWFDPVLGPESFDRIALTNPKSSRTTISFNDYDKTMRTQWYSTKFDCDAEVYWFLRGLDGAWTNVLTIVWSVEECSFNRRGQFKISLSAAAGSRPRAGGTIGTKSEFPYAPTPGEALRIGTSGGANGGITWRPGIGVPPPPPGGQQHAHDPRGVAVGSDTPITRGPSDRAGGTNQQAQGGSTSSATS